MAGIHLIDPTREQFGHSLLLQTVRVNPDRMPNWKRNVALSAQPWMWEEFGAHLLAAGASITGAPGVVTLLWMVGVDYSPARTAMTLRGRRWHQDFLADLEDLHEEVLAPMGYDPERNLAPGHEPAMNKTQSALRAATPVPTWRTFLIDHIQVPSRQLGEFSQGKRKVFVPLVTTQCFGWRLVASGVCVSERTLRSGGQFIGPDGGLRASEPSTTVVNFWELPGPEALPRVMLHLSEDPGYQTFRQGTVGNEEQHLLLPVGNCDPHPVWSQPDVSASQDLQAGRWLYR